MGYTEFNGYQNGSGGQYTIHLNCTYTSNGSNANTSNVYMHYLSCEVITVLIGTMKHAAPMWNSGAMANTTKKTLILI